jgi:hypothetical protein
MSDENKLPKIAMVQQILANSKNNRRDSPVATHWPYRHGFRGAKEAILRRGVGRVDNVEFGCAQKSEKCSKKSTIGKIWRSTDQIML